MVASSGHSVGSYGRLSSLVAQDCESPNCSCNYFLTLSKNFTFFNPMELSALWRCREGPDEDYVAATKGT